MTQVEYKKMAGTAAVFISTEFAKAAPVERDGLVWSEAELHLEYLADQRQVKSAMANVLALEGLEDYDPPSNGDVRKVASMDIDFVYLDRIHGWLQVPA